MTGRGLDGRGVLANDAWEALLAAHAVLMKQFAAEGIWAELSMREYDVLYTLAKCPAPVRISELNRHVLLSQPALSRLVDRLAGRGLVCREADPADGRGIRLSLTAAGRALQRRIGRQHARGVARAMTAGLDRGELRALEAICLKLTAATESAGEAGPTTATEPTTATAPAAAPGPDAMGAPAIREEVAL